MEKGGNQARRTKCETRISADEKENRPSSVESFQGWSHVSSKPYNVRSHLSTSPAMIHWSCRLVVVVCLISPIDCEQQSCCVETLFSLPKTYDQVGIKPGVRRKVIITRTRTTNNQIQGNELACVSWISVKTMLMSPTARDVWIRASN